MWRPSCAIVLAVVLPLLSACTQWHYQLGTLLSRADLPDTTQQHDLTTVLASLGPPQRMSATPGGYVLAWEYWWIRETTVGISLGFIGADFLNVDWGDARTFGNYLLLSFDHQHQLSSASYQEWDSDVGGGQGLQPLFSVVPLAQTRDLRRSMPQHSWGSTSLQRLPASLNVNNQPDLGGAGIEQRGTPDGTGQRSLDFR